MGLNNLNCSDYVNSLILLLSNVRPLRDILLLSKYEPKSEFLSRFGRLIRKLWNTKAFKNHVSPHEFLQELSRASKKQFQQHKRVDPVQLLPFMMNELHFGLGGSRKRDSIITETFQGILIVTSQVIVSVSTDNAETAFSPSNSPFLYLQMDLPENPLFIDESERTSIQQVMLTDLLKKYDGKTETAAKLLTSKYHIAKLPEYLLMCFRRFSIKDGIVNKKSTVINFPTEGLDMSNCNFC